MFETFLLAFIPLFVAVDPIGVLPIFVSLTQDVPKGQKKLIIIESLLTAVCLAVAFILLGKAIFRVLGITVADFMIAGGAILFCLAIIDLINPGKQRKLPAKELGFVPLGTPLIVGPAVLTTSLIVVQSYGVFIALLAVFLNIVIIGVLLLSADTLISKLGDAGAKAISKIVSLLLAAIAIMMIRKGLFEIIIQLQTRQ